MEGRRMTKFQKWIALIGQARVARLLGVPRQRVNAWFREGRIPADITKKKIVAISGLTYEDFFKEEE